MVSLIPWPLTDASRVGGRFMDARPRERAIRRLATETSNGSALPDYVSNLPAFAHGKRLRNRRLLFSMSTTRRRSSSA